MARSGASGERLGRFDHIREFLFDASANSFGQRAQFAHEVQLGSAEAFELAEDIGFDPAAEEFGGGHVVDGEEREKLSELYRRDTLAGLERTERLLTHAGRERRFLLREAAQATQFAELEYKVHCLFYLLSAARAACQWDAFFGARTVFAAIGGFVVCFDSAAFFFAASIAPFATFA
jgi:hypothetical protein